MILVDNGSTKRPANVSGSNPACPLSHATWGPNSPRGGGTTADMILSEATNGNTEYEIYDIGNNAISAGYLLGKIGADWQFAGLGGFTAGANCRPAALMLASAGCGHANRIRLCARTANRDH